MKLKQILTCGLLPFFVITTKFIELVVSSTVPKTIKIKLLFPSGFYLRKKVAGSTLKIEGSIFRAKLRMRGPKAREGGEPERGVSLKKILKIG